MARQVKSRLSIYRKHIKKLERAQVKALEQTGEYLHTEVVQAQVIPRDTGALQNEKFFVDMSNSANGTVSLAWEGPYARRLYYHPEYHFDKTANPNAKGKWMKEWEPGGKKEKDVVKAYVELYRKGLGL